MVAAHPRRAVLVAGNALLVALLVLHSVDHVVRQSAPVLPEWSVFSQPYADIDVDAVSWMGMLVPAVAAALVGVLALRSRLG